MCQMCITCHLDQDKSWRVRYNVALQIPTLTEAFGKDAVQQQLGALFVSLLRDAEAEVCLCGY